MRMSILVGILQRHIIIQEGRLQHQKPKIFRISANAYITSSAWPGFVHEMFVHNNDSPLFIWTKNTRKIGKDYGFAGRDTDLHD